MTASQISLVFHDFESFEELVRYFVTQSSGGNCVVSFHDETGLVGFGKENHSGKVYCNPPHVKGTQK